jgi:hypothetical protein
MITKNTHAHKRHRAAAGSSSLARTRHSRRVTYLASTRAPRDRDGCVTLIRISIS